MFWGLRPWLSWLGGIRGGRCYYHYRFAGRQQHPDPPADWRCVHILHDAEKLAALASGIDLGRGEDHSLEVGEEVTEEFRAGNGKGIAVWRVTARDGPRLWRIEPRRGNPGWRSRIACGRMARTRCSNATCSISSAAFGFRFSIRFSFGRASSVNPRKRSRMRRRFWRSRGCGELYVLIRGVRRGVEPCGWRSELRSTAQRHESHRQGYPECP